jgi:hypothetical protein
VLGRRQGLDQLLGLEKHLGHVKVGQSLLVEEALSRSHALLLHLILQRPLDALSL